MRFHSERDKRLYPIRHSQGDAPPPDNKKFVVRRHATLVQRPIRSKRSEFQLNDEWIADDSLMITVCYEAHVAMQKMLSVFAEMRGDDTADPIE